MRDPARVRPPHLRGQPPGQAHHPSTTYRQTPSLTRPSTTPSFVYSPFIRFYSVFVFAISSPLSKTCREPCPKWLTEPSRAGERSAGRNPKILGGGGGDVFRPGVPNRGSRTPAGNFRKFYSVHRHRRVRDTSTRNAVPAIRPEAGMCRIRGAMAPPCSSWIGDDLQHPKTRQNAV